MTIRQPRNLSVTDHICQQNFTMNMTVRMGIVGHFIPLPTLKIWVEEDPFIAVNTILSQPQLLPDAKSNNCGNLPAANNILDKSKFFWA